MKKTIWAAVVAALAGTIVPLSAADLVHDSAYLPNTAGLTIEAPANETKTADLIDKINEYGYAQLLINSGEAARNHFNDRVHWEFHLGGGEGYYPGAIGNMPDYRDGASSRYSFFAMGIKYNLTNPKIVKPYDVLGELKRLHSLLQVRNFTFTDELKADCDRMIAEDQAYLSKYWFKRWSVGLDFIYLDRGMAYSQNYNDYSYSSGNNSTGFYNTNSNRSNSYSYGNSGTPGLDFYNPFLFVGTDLGDYLTLKAGYSVQNHFMVGISTDISTAVFNLGTDFFSYIKTFSGAPQASGYPAGVR